MRLLTVIFLLATTVHGQLDGDAVARHFAALTAAPHRLCGSDAGRAAGDYLAAQLRLLPGAVRQQRFRLPQEDLGRCELTVNGQTVPLTPFRANGMQPSSTPPGGLRGHLIHLGDGSPARSDGADFTGAIVTVDFNTQTLAEPFRRGAAAVIYVGDETNDREFSGAKRSHISVDLPRFYLERTRAEQIGLLAAGAATIESQVSWRLEAEGRNIFCYLPATEETAEPQFVILSAAYDSRGIVPWLAFDDVGAMNCAVLLETARLLARQPRPRGVLIACFDGQANFLQGSREFYTAYRRSLPEKAGDEPALVQRQRYVTDERDYVEQQIAFLESSDLFAEAASRTDNRLQERSLYQLAIEAKTEYETYQEQLGQLRLRMNSARRNDQSTAQAEAELARCSQVFRQWQAVRESIRDRKPVAAAAEQTFAVAVSQLLARIQLRRIELDDVRDELADAVALTDLLRGARPVVHLSYRFSGGTAGWLVMGYEQHFDGMLEALHADLRTAGAANFVWQAQSTAATRAFSFWDDLGTQIDSQIGMAFTIPGFALITEQDKVPTETVPEARLPAAARDQIRQQADQAMPVVQALLSAPWVAGVNRILSNKQPNIDDYEWTGDGATGHQVKSYGYGGSTAERIEPRVVVHVMLYGHLHAPSAAVFPNEFMTGTDANGCFALRLPEGDFGLTGFRRNFCIESAKFGEDGRFRQISTATPSGGLASVATGWQRAARYMTHDQRRYYSVVPLFSGHPAVFFGRTYPFGEALVDANFELLSGLANSAFRLRHLRYDVIRGVGIVYVDQPMGIKLIYRDRIRQDTVGMCLNTTADAPTGTGFGPHPADVDAGIVPRLDLRAAMASDLYRLNESRLQVFRDKNIVLNSLESLQVRARSRHGSLQQAAARREYSIADALAAELIGYERRIYGPVVATTNDLIAAITILLLLAIPFAACLQALLWTTASIYRKLAQFIACFMASFFLLWLVHPAFSFTASPIVIILAFNIIVMSSLVIWIIYNKFSYEIKSMQGLASAAHQMNTSRFGNVSAAVALAVSTMKRRPVRTALTVATVVMLTFTILSFVSFESERGINRFYQGTGDATPRVLLHRRAWRAIHPDTMADVRRLLGPDFTVVGRYWRVQDLQTDSGKEEALLLPLRHRDGEGAALNALMSLDAASIERIPALAAIFAAAGDGAAARFAEGRSVLLSPATIEQLQAAPGDPLRLAGVELTLLGSFAPNELAEVRLLDGSPLLPVDFALSKIAMGGFENRGSAGTSSADVTADLVAEFDELEPDSLEPVPARAVAVVSDRLAAELSLSLRGIVIYPPAEADIEAIGEKLAVFWDDPVYVNNAGARSKLFYGDRVGIGGLGDVALPLFIGALIIFSTMLGSIIDRREEIYTFSALGLAPRNIAMLFFFEAGIYAVLGGFGGYLFSQVVVFGLEALSHFGMFAAPEMNYSSSTAINTILLVMATVMASTAIPAIRAARTATARTASRWRIPPPQNDVCRFDFPFTISRFDVVGVLRFIGEHFENHADRTVGHFAAADVDISGDDDGEGPASFSARVWLQPFDQGISQLFRILPRESDIEDVYEMQVEMQRVSGPPHAWQRAYVRFLEDLRVQFLLWRTLEDEERDQYLCR